MSMLASYAAFVAIVRMVLLYLALAVAAVCAFDWAVRTRRISPFNRIARFFRGRIEPAMAPVERVVVRAGGVPSAAPLWTLATVVVGGILLVTLLQIIGGVLEQIVFGVANPDPRSLVMLGLSWVFSILKLALLVRVISGWLPISPHSKWIRWSYVLTEWMLRPLRRLIPLIGMFDITPIVAWILLSIVQSIFGIP